VPVFDTVTVTEPVFPTFTGLGETTTKECEAVIARVNCADVAAPKIIFLIT
jgi:hypothetical protein